MKKYIVSLILAHIVLVSCEENKVIFNESQTLVSFDVNNVDLPIEIDANGSVEIMVNVSSISEAERTISVQVIEEETTAETASYTVGSIVVPANSYTGILKIDGWDNNVTNDPKLLVLEVPDSADFSGGRKLNVSIFLVCPVPESLFTGRYLIEQLSAENPNDSYTFEHNMIVELTADGLKRTFVTSFLPKWCSSARGEFTFNLVCNELIVPVQDLTTFCHCGSPVDYWGPGTVSTTYSVNDDSEFTINFRRDVQEFCGNTPSGGEPVSYKFTKVE